MSIYIRALYINRAPLLSLTLIKLARALIQLLILPDFSLTSYIGHVVTQVLHRPCERVTNVIEDDMMVIQVLHKVYEMAEVCPECCVGAGQEWWGKLGDKAFGLLRLVMTPVMYGPSGQLIFDIVTLHI